MEYLFSETITKAGFKGGQLLKASTNRGGFHTKHLKYYYLRKHKNTF